MKALVARYRAAGRHRPNGMPPAADPWAGHRLDPYGFVACDMGPWPPVSENVNTTGTRMERRT
jgi:hypothetical protein